MLHFQLLWSCLPSSASSKPHTTALHNLIFTTPHLEPSSPPLVLRLQANLNLQLYWIICRSQDARCLSSVSLESMHMLYSHSASSPDYFYLSITIQSRHHVLHSLSWQRLCTPLDLGDPWCAPTAPNTHHTITACLSFIRLWEWMKTRKISQITTLSLCNWSLRQALENVGLYGV